MSGEEIELPQVWKAVIRATIRLLEETLDMGKPISLANRSLRHKLAILGTTVLLRHC